MSGGTVAGLAADAAGAARRQPLAGRLLGCSAIAAAWAAYLPLGLKYAVAVVAAALAIAVVRASDVAAQPATRPLVALLALLVLSAAWSPAPWPRICSHLWFYALPLLVPLLAAALPADAAARALQHFVGASALAAALLLLDRAGVLPHDPPWLWLSPAAATGNQRIANSVLLALAVALALWFALDGAAPPRRRVWWLLGGASIGAGLLLQDRRSGMLVLPLLLLVVAWARQRSAWRRAALVAAICGAAVLAVAAIDAVRERFDEGWRELRADVPADRVDTSWGQRLHMLRLTAGMVRERPLFGHGVGSWQTLWAQRTSPGSALAAHTTPHSEVLLVAEQAGIAGLVLLLAVIGAMLLAAARRGAAGVPALLVWTALATAGLFNAVLRDGKFSLPLLLLAAIAGAAAGRARQPASAKP